MTRREIDGEYSNLVHDIWDLNDEGANNKYTA